MKNLLTKIGARASRPQPSPANDCARLGTQLHETAHAPAGGTPALRLALLATLWLITTMEVFAQQYAIDWSTVNGGGGASTGGVYALSGTIGQPDAGAMSGGGYALQGGFWSAFVVPTPGAPLLRIARAGTNIMVSWPRSAPGFILDQTPTLQGTPPPWTPVPFPYQTNGATVSVTLAPAPGANFFRMRQP